MLVDDSGGSPCNLRSLLHEKELVNTYPQVFNAGDILALIFVLVQLDPESAVFLLDTGSCALTIHQDTAKSLSQEILGSAGKDHERL